MLLSYDGSSCLAIFYRLYFQVEAVENVKSMFLQTNLDRSVQMKNPHSEHVSLCTMEPQSILNLCSSVPRQLTPILFAGMDVQVIKLGQLTLPIYLWDLKSLVSKTRIRKWSIFRFPVYVRMRNSKMKIIEVCVAIILAQLPKILT